MRKILLGVMLTVASVAAQASGSASVTCSGYAPVLTVNYSPGDDVGVPGLFWMGALTPDQRGGALLVNRNWVVYKGGMYPFQARYDGGFPRTISITIPFPGGGQTTAGYVGYGIYAGHGGYTAQAMQAVAKRRSVLDRVKADRVAAGTWQSDYDSDERYIWALTQKNMVENDKFGLVMTVPFVDCAPDYDSGR